VRPISAELLSRTLHNRAPVADDSAFKIVTRNFLQAFQAKGEVLIAQAKAYKVAGRVGGNQDSPTGGP
jgi:hypothetical protein